MVVYGSIKIMRLGNKERGIDKMKLNQIVGDILAFIALAMASVFMIGIIYIYQIIEIKG